MTAFRFLVLMAVAAWLSGCASIHAERHITDHRGKNRGVVIADGRNMTSKGAAELLAELGRFEETQHHELEELGKRSIDKGQPTTVTTPRGNVTSGYTGYGGYGGYYGPYTYEQFGINPALLPSGVVPEALLGERLYQLDRARTPRLMDTPPVPYQVPLYQQPYQQPGVAPLPSPSAGPVPCPTDRYPQSEAERIACLEKDFGAILRLHDDKKK